MFTKMRENLILHMPTLTSYGPMVIVLPYDILIRICHLYVIWLLGRHLWPWTHASLLEFLLESFIVMMESNHGWQLDDQNIINMSNYFFNLRLQKPKSRHKESLSLQITGMSLIFLRNTKPFPAMFTSTNIKCFIT